METPPIDIAGQRNRERERERERVTTDLVPTLLSARTLWLATSAHTVAKVCLCV